MNKYYGTVGYIKMVKTGIDVCKPEIIERNYRGDIVENNRKWVESEYLNDDLVINNAISIVADPYAYNNFHDIKYATFMGTKWKVSNVKVAYPRLILYLGGVYNEQES